MIMALFFSVLLPVDPGRFCAASCVCPKNHAEGAAAKDKVVGVNCDVLSANFAIGFRIPVRPFSGIKGEKTNQFALMFISDVIDYLGLS